jgi:predicted outer membrane repeat protein
LASADLDRDGAPDLIAGYTWSGKGILTVQRGNPDAFAPKDDAVFERLQKGYNPDSLLPRTETYESPEPIDFLQVGDFNEDAAKDVLFAALGGGLYLLPGDGMGGLRKPQEIPLPGTVTALTAGEFNAADGRTDAAVGITGPDGPALLIFQEPTGSFSSPLSIALGAEATAVQFGELDDDPFLDVAVAAGREIYNIHGWGRARYPKLESRVQRIDLGFQIRDLAIGNFIWNRAGDSQLAVLGDDSTVRVLQRGNLNTRRFSEEEMAARSNARSRVRLTPSRTAVDVESLPSWQPGGTETWTRARELATGRVSVANAGRGLLTRSHIGFREADDLLLLGAGERELQILRQIDPNDGTEPEALSTAPDFATASLKQTNAPVAVVALPQKLNGVRDLLVLTAGGESSVKVVPLLPTAIITVDRTDDTAAASACTAGGNDCSLRGAFQFANQPANAGTTIMLPANTYVLSINGTSPGGCDGNATGDLGANQSITLTGAGAATTIIRQTGTGPANDGDRVMCMNEPFTVGLVYTFSGVSFVGGREGSATGTGTALGGAGIIGGELNNSLTLTSVVFTNNQETVAGSANLGGGGLQITGGNLIITNSTFGGTSAPGAYTDRSSTNTGNSQAGSGGGVTYTPSSPAHTGGSGTLTVTGSTFSRNTSSGIGGGGVDLLIFAFAAPGGIGSGSGTISTSTFSNNQAANGGGIIVESLPTTVATTSFTNNSASNRGGGIYVGGGSLLLNGATPSITFTGNTAVNAGSSVSTAAPVNVDGTNTTIGGDIEVSTGGSWTNNAGSTLAPTNVVITGGTLNMNNSTMNVGGNLTIGPAAIVGATFNGNSGTINIQGNLTTNSGGAPATTFNPGTSTFNFNGTGAQSINGSLSPTFNNLTDSNITQPLTINNSISVNGTLNVNGATATLAPVAASIISGAGTLTGAGTARVTRIAATADFSSQYTITNKTLTNLTVDYIGSAAQVLSAITYGPLKITNAAGVNEAAGTATVNGLLTLTTGTLNVQTSTLVINNGTAVGTGGLASGATGTVNYNQGSAGQNVLAANYGNLTFSNQNKVLASAGTIGIAGVFTTGAAVGHTIAGSTINFNGSVAQTIPAFNYNNLTSSSTGARTLANVGTIGVAGSFTPGTNAYTITGSTIDFNGAGAQAIPAFNYNNLTSSNIGGRILANSGTIGIAGAFNQGANVYTITGSTINFNGAGAQVIPAFNYNNLTSSNAGARTLANTGTIGIAGAFTPGANAYTIAGSTINFNGGGPQTIPAFNYNNLTSSNSGARTLANAGTIGIAEIFTPGTNVYTITGSTINFNGAVGQTIPAFNYNNLTSSNTGARTLANSGIIGIAGVFTPGTNVYTIIGSTVAYNGSAAQSIPSGFTTYDNLTLNNAAGVTGFSGLIVQGLLRIQQGTFTSSSTYNSVQIDGGATLAATAASTINIGGSWTNNGTFSANTGTVVFNGASAQTINGTTTFNNLTINNANGVSFGAGTNVTAGATLTLTAGVFAVGTNTLTLNGAVTATSGTLTSAATGTVNYNQASNGQSVLAANYGNLTFSNFTKILPSSGAVGIAGIFTTGAAVGHTITGSTVDFNGAGAQTMPAFNYNNLTSSNTGARTLVNGGTIGIAGVFTPGTNVFTITGNTIIFNGTSAQSLPSSFSTYNNLTLNNAAGTTGFAGLTTLALLRVQAGTFTSSSTYKDVQIDIGATLAASSGSTINVSGNWTNNGTFTPNNGTVNFNGTLAQTIGGSSTTTFNNLTINNSLGVSLGADIAINAILTLQAGTLSIGSRTLTLNNSISIASGSFTSNANGTVNYNQSSNGQNVAPGNYGNLTFSNFQKNLPGSGTVKIAGTFTTGAGGGHTLTGSTVEFNGASAQTLPSNFTTYNNLTLNNAAGATGFAGLIVQGLLRVQAGTFTTSSSFKDVQIDNGATLAATAASTINVSGNWTNDGTFTANTSTVNFNGASAQTIGGSSTTTFNNFTVNNAAGVNLSANETVNGEFMLTSGALGVGAHTLIVNGAATATAGIITSGANGTVNYNQSSNGQAVLAADYGNLAFSDFTKTLSSTGIVRIAGVFTTGAAGGHTITGSTVEFNGASPQTTPSGFGAFNNLTINNVAGVTLGSGTTVASGVLQLTNGNLDAGVNTMELTATGSITRTTGHVIGNLKKSFAATGLFIYHVGTANGYSPVDVNITAGTGELTVKAVQGPQPILNAAKSLQRYWSLAGSGVTTNLTFHYLDGDVTGDESIYRLIRVSGATAVIFPVTPPTVDPDNNTAFITGVDAFSDWTAGEPTAPTAVTDVTLDATEYDGGVFVRWQTAGEVENLGFNLYRDERGERVLVNPQIVAGSALVAGSKTVVAAGQSYGWWDSNATGPAHYWLEDIDVNGRSSWHGPFSSKRAGGSPPARSQAALLSKVGTGQSGITLPVDVTAPLVADPSRLGPTAQEGGQAAIKLSVRREGFYRATVGDLVAAGLDPGVDPARLQMFVDGRQLPISVRTDTSGQLIAVEFYGIGLDSAATDSRVYWLIAGQKPGMRIAQASGQGRPSDSGSFLYTAERKDRTIYFSALRNGERENFFGAVVSSAGVEQSLTLRNLSRSPNDQATIELALQGVTNSQHRVWAYLNGSFLGELVLDGQSAATAKFPVEQSSLKEGQNLIHIVDQGDPSSISLADHIRVGYWHSFTADDEALRFTAPADRSITLRGFSEREVRVFDITDPDSVQELRTRVKPDNGGGFLVTVSAPGAGERRLFAVADNRALPADKVTANIPSSLRSSTHAADLLIITRPDFFAAFEPLARLRREQGLKVETVNIEDIYDEFSFGHKSTQSVKDFLLFASTNWSVKPRYVLFGADSSFDPKNYLGLGDWDIVPSRLIDTALMETVSDEWYADFDGDGLADLTVGRVPARFAADASALVAKIISYERNTESQEMLLVADVNDQFSFEAANEQLKTLIPPGFRVNEVSRGALDIATARAQLVEAALRGQKIINYTGHGSVNQWRGGLLTNEDAPLLAESERPSIFVLMTCLNGYGIDPALASLGEALLMTERGGAVAVWASSGMTPPDQQAEMNQHLYRTIFGVDSRQMTIGEIFARAKSQITDSDIRRTWILLGDPSMKLK